MITINGVELDVEALDADFVERVQRAAEALGERDSQIPEDPAASIRYQCACIRTFFDEVFGEGTGAAVLPKDNEAVAFAAVEAVSVEALRQREEHRSRMQRYAPNRAKHRAK